MALFAFLFCLLILRHSLSVPIITSLQNIQFDEITTEESAQVGWIKIFSCSSESITTYDINANLSSYAISIKFVPQYSRFHPKYAQYAITAKPCSNPILSLNNQKEISFVVNPATGQIQGAIDLSDWIGTSTAKTRLLGGDCFAQDPLLYTGGHSYDFPNTIIYLCADNALQIIPPWGYCSWSVNDDEGMEIYLGFDANKTTHCNSTKWRTQPEVIPTQTEPVSVKNSTDSVSDLLTMMEFDESSTYMAYDIGWKRIISCSNGTILQENDYTIDDIEMLLPFVMSVRISPPVTASEYDDFVLETVPCSHSIYAINNRKEMTWNIDTFDFSIQSNALYDDWVGSNTAKQRLQTGTTIDCRRYLGLYYARDFPVIYSNCDHGLHIDIGSSVCKWNISEGTSNQDMEIYFGFDVDKSTDSKCIHAVDDINMTHSDRYILVRHELNWFDAELFCEQHFQTTLAIITKDVELHEAINLRYSVGLEDDDVWIGLHKSHSWSNDSFWYWYSANNATETRCDYTVHGGCEYDTHWIMERNYTKMDLVESRCAAIEAYGDAFEAFNSYSCDQRHTFLCDTQNTVTDAIDNEQSCDIYIENEIDIEQQALRVEDVQVEFNMISFSIKLDRDFECIATHRCNILHIGQESRTNLPSVFITGNHLEIYFFDGGTNWGANIMHNAVDILSDGNYHRIDLIFSTLSRQYKIDHVSYYFEEMYYEFTEHIGTIHPLYISSPWITSVNGKIKNVCIKTYGKELKVGWLPEIYLSDPFETLSLAYWNKQFYIYSFRVINEDTGEYVLGMYFSSEYTIASTQTFYDILTWSIINFDYGSLQPVLPHHVLYYSSYEHILTGRKTVQDEEMFYIIQGIADSHEDAIFVFNLTAKSLERTTIIPSKYSQMYNITNGISIAGCVTKDDDYLYIVLYGIILYNKANDSFIETSVTSNDFQVAFAGCAVTHDQQRMFIFGGLELLNDEITDKVYEYDIAHGTLSLLEVTLNSIAYDVAAFAAYDQIFVHGNFGNTKKETHIFNVVSKEFEPYIFDDRLVDIRYDPLRHGYDPYANRMTYDPGSNSLMRITNESIDVLIIHTTKIDFTPTQSQMWRSNVWIDYNLFTYTSYDGLYKFLLQIQLTNNIEYVLMIDATDEQCYVCNDDEWSVDCLHGCNLPIDDDIIENMSIEITSINQNIDSFSTFILNVEFLKCMVDIEMKVLANNYVTVSVTPRNVDICASNTQPIYITNIYNDAVGIHHKIMVEITDSTTTCNICLRNDTTNCVLCSDGIQLQPNIALDVEETYFIQLWSNTTDLFIYPAIIEVPFEKTIFENRINETLSPLAIALIIISCVVVAIAVCFLYVRYAKYKKLREEVQRQKDNTQEIRNPLVLYIGVAVYEKKVIDKGIDVHCPDLDGVDKDAVNIKLMCTKFQYDLYPKFDENPKLQWKQTEVIQFLKESSKKAATGDYDSILVIFSSHGYQHSIITSDYQTINKDAVVRLFTALHPELSNIPRIFIFDCCDGERQREGLDDDSDSEDDEQGKHTKDIGKNFEIGDIQKIRSVPDEIEEEEAANEIKNSNYKLVTIHAANTGFQSKLNSIDGSYVINAFVRRMLKDIASGNHNFFGEVMQDIQHKLHQDGKQCPTNVFQDNTRYLKFSANPEKSLQSDHDEKMDTNTKTNDDYQIMVTPMSNR